MAFTSDDLAALEAAIKGGALKVKYSDKEITYRSLEEMLRLRDIMRKDAGVTSVTNKRVKMEFSKGLDRSCADERV